LLFLAGVAAAQGNTSLGTGAFQDNTTGSFNTASGFQALFSNTTGTLNTANGVNALANNIMGDSNTAGGVDALFSNSTGGNNTANGVSALFGNTTGDNNTAIGAGANAIHRLEVFLLGLVRNDTKCHLPFDDRDSGVSQADLIVGLTMAPEPIAVALFRFPTDKDNSRESLGATSSRCML
jgi:hypothetical protein